MVSSDSQIDKAQCRRPKRAELPDVNINMGVQSINTERANFVKDSSFLFFCTRLVSINNSPPAADVAGCTCICFTSRGMK